MPQTTHRALALSLTLALTLGCTRPGASRVRNTAQLNDPKHVKDSAAHRPAPTAPLTTVPTSDGASTEAVTPEHPLVPEVHPSPAPETLWARDDREYWLCPRTAEAAHAQAVPEPTASAWRERFTELATELRALDRNNDALQKPARFGKIAVLMFEEQGAQGAVWFEALHFELPRWLRAETPSEATTILVGHSFCFWEYPPGELLHLPRFTLWQVSRHKVANVSPDPNLAPGKPLDTEAIRRWLLALPVAR